jgi:hypothetical protein
MLARQTSLRNHLPSTLTPLLRYSCKLFVAPENLNSFAINQIQTLCAKHPGYGVPLHTSHEPRVTDHVFARPLFSHSYELLFRQPLSFHNHPRCPRVWVAFPFGSHESRVTSHKSRLLMGLPPLCRSQKSQLLCNQANPGSFAKIPGWGGYPECFYGLPGWGIPNETTGHPGRVMIFHPHLTKADDAGDYMRPKVRVRTPNKL